MVTKVGPIVKADKGLVDRKIFYDQDIYQQELEQVFGRSWLFVGHDSQVPKPNDFVANYMAEDPVLVTRDAKGRLHTFLNMCRHRGNRVCRADSGNAPSFMCTYHGWTFASDGKLVGVPGYKEAYFEELDRSQWGLVEAPTAAYKGLIFANWDSKAPSIVDFLGDMAWYLDLLLDRRDGGTELVGGIHRWVMDFNWKFGSDNFGGDNYHVPASHGSMAAAGINQQRPPFANQADKSRFSVYAGNGHCVTSGGYSGINLNPLVANQKPQAGQEGAYYMIEHQKELEERLGSIRGKQLALGIGTVFPNLTWHSSPTLRIWHPRGPQKTEIWSYCIVDKKAPEDIKQAMARNYILRFGPAGTMEQDDAFNWNNSTATAKSLKARQYPLNMQMGIGHEWKNETHPGLLSHTVSETNWRGFYGWWSRMMDAPSWSDVNLDPITAK